MCESDIYLLCRFFVNIGFRTNHQFVFCKSTFEELLRIVCNCAVKKYILIPFEIFAYKLIQLFVLWLKECIEIGF